jgi:ribonuclease HI
VNMTYKSTLRKLSPSGRLENQSARKTSLLRGLEFLRDLGARDIDVFRYSNLIMQQIRGGSQCLDGVLNSYRDR